MKDWPQAIRELTAQLKRLRGGAPDVMRAFAAMAQAANRLAEVGGGVVVIRDGEEIALVELPIAGLMSTERAEVVAGKAQQMVQAFVDCGCTLNNAFMQLSLLALVVIPELRISDLGLVDATRFEVTPLFA